MTGQNGHHLLRLQCYIATYKHLSFRILLGWGSGHTLALLNVHPSTKLALMVSYPSNLHLENRVIFGLASFIVQILYDNGARRMVLFGLGQIGCSPNELAQNSRDGSTCVQKINSANQIFNNRLKSLVTTLNSNTPDARFIYVDSFGIFQDIISRPSAFGKIISIQF